SPKGTIVVGTRIAGKIYAIVDEDKDYRADKVYTLLDKNVLPDGTTLKMPNGVAFKDGALYVGALGHILRLDNIEARLADPPAPVIVSHQHPDKQHHGWKFIAFGPDGKLYVPVGAPCNICDREEDIFASITRMNADGSDLEIIAHGVRHTVGFDWHPETKELWFTDNGRDMMGDEIPADELNRLSEAGQHFGFPYVHQGDVLDPIFGEGHSTGEFVLPSIRLGPHVAALGMRFYTGSMFPEEYRGQIFIAEHGSWNRSSKIGYRVTLVRLEGNKAVSYETFMDGWLQGRRPWGRPADVLVMPDGSLLVSDEKSGTIFRVTYDS
ncbi:MAG: sorbosone dehydrogenase family protein, partial [Candidatus Hydrogenedentes bacterium]|nr:sorbosone dehydrogenase family protein [Candidatus Hydrogenedentota bacterium]